MRKTKKPKSQNSRPDWSDLDDAPELTDEFFEKGVWRIGEKIVSREEAQQEAVKYCGWSVGTAPN